MHAVLLAAGLSTRLRPLTDTIPKCLIPVGGIPLLQRSLESLSGVDVEECIIVVGYRADQIHSFVGSLHLPFKVSFVLNAHFAETSNNYSLWLTGEAVSGREMLLLDADILFAQDILHRLVSSPHSNVLAMKTTMELGPEEIKVITNTGGMVTHIGKEIDPTKSAGESIGIERFSGSSTRTLFEILERRRQRHEFYEASFQELIDRGEKVYAMDIGDAPCVEIDTAEDLSHAELLAAQIQS
jgi:choline kinase